MGADKRKKLTKGKLAAIISAAAVLVIFVSLLVTNIFIPVKYLTAYMVVAEDREKGVLTVTYADVGYGDAILIELPDGKVALIDGGDGSYGNTLSLLRLLNSRGADRIDYLICSSVRAEHCGGLAEIIKYKTVGAVYAPFVNNTYITEEYRNFYSEATKKGVNMLVSQYGEGIYSNEYGYFLTFLSPGLSENPEGFYAALNQSATEKNILNASAVIWLSYAGTDFVFTSSAGREALQTILNDYAMMTAVGDKYAPIGGYSVNLGDCDVVQVAGHGSSLCTCAEWYEILSPSAAVLSVGSNYSDCPSAQALSDVCRQVKEPLITQDRGNITIRVTNDGYSVL